MRRVVLAVLTGTACAVLGLGACAEEPEQPGRDTTRPRPTPSTESPPSRPGTTTPAPRPPDGAQVTVRGTVRPGVEPNCLVLANDEREYLLLDGGPEVRAGATVVVRGTVRHDIATTCMQGIPLVVEDANPVEGG